MGLDATTIVAQIINFAVLVWLLNRFLYRPIMDMIAAREENMRRRLDQAETMEAKARQEIETYRELQAELERERGRLLAEAREAARQERIRLLEEAAEEARQARCRFAEALAAERAELASSFQERIVRHVCDTSGRILLRLGGVTLVDAIIGTLEARWEEAPLEGPAAPASPVVVRTSFQPTPEQKARLAALAARIAQRAFHPETGRNADAPPPIRFQVDPDLLLGIEIEWGGSALAWTARDMLEDLQKEALDGAAPRAGERPAAVSGFPAGEPSGAGEVKSGA